MSDEIRMQNELTFDTFKNSVEENVLVVRRDQDFLMTVKMIAKLYGVDVSTVRKSLRQMFWRKELRKKSVSEILPHRADDGKLYETRYYNHVAIVKLGLALRSPEAKSFQNWIENRGRIAMNHEQVEGLE